MLGQQHESIAAATRVLLALLRTDEGRIDNRKAEAHLVAIVCGDPPEGHTRWTLKQPEDKAVE